MIKQKLTLLILFFPFLLFSQDIRVEKIEPPNWWAGMKWDKLQLMVYGENLTSVKASFDNKKLKINRVYDVSKDSRGNYAFIDVSIPNNIKPGNYLLTLRNSHSKTSINYPIIKRENKPEEHKGFHQDDIIYLIMPDRFSDGDTTNNVVPGFNDQYNRADKNARHGGDLQGIINHLDYIKEAGFTALWINPVVENNCKVSYHGYSATDFYKVDPRLGSNELYKKLVKEAHKRNIKIILDHVANHFHINHPWMKNLPVKGWINGSPDNFEITNHDKVAIADVHGDSSTLNISTTGWFTDFLPDLNQANPFVANYIIQNTIWWMEYAGIDAIREDTYPYCDPGFMAVWDKALLNEYPSSNIVGEIWKGEPLFLSIYQQNGKANKAYNSYLPSITDFALSEALRSYLSGSNNLNHIYEILAMDFIYNDPYNLVTFIDNHDIERAMFTASGNEQKVKIALQILLTTRGIPQILYATELGVKGNTDHGDLRMDFPGGFPGDKRNAFSFEGRSADENEMYNIIHNTLKIRKENAALSSGELIQFPPRDNVYIYFRVLGNEKVMVVVNDNQKEKNADLTQVNHLLNNATKFVELKSGVEIPVNSFYVTVKAEDVNIYKVITK